MRQIKPKTKKTLVRQFLKRAKQRFARSRKTASVILILFLSLGMGAQTGIFSVTEVTQDHIAAETEYNLGLGYDSGQGVLTALDTAQQVLYTSDTAVYGDQIGGDTLSIDSLSAGTTYKVQYLLARDTGGFVATSETFVTTPPHATADITSFTSVGFDSTEVCIDVQTYGEEVSLSLSYSGDTVLVAESVIDSMYCITVATQPDSQYVFSLPGLSDTSQAYQTPPYPDPPSISIIDGIARCDSFYFRVVIDESGGLLTTVSLSYEDNGMPVQVGTRSGTGGDTMLFGIDSVVSFMQFTTVEAVASSLAGFATATNTVALYPPQAPSVHVDSTGSVSPTLGFVQAAITPYCENNTVWAQLHYPSTGVAFVWDSLVVDETDTSATLWFSGLNSATTYQGVIYISNGIDTTSKAFLITTQPYPGPNVSADSFVVGPDWIELWGFVDWNAPVRGTVYLRKEVGSTWHVVDSTDADSLSQIVVLGDTNLSLNTTYKYDLVAVNDSGASDTTFWVPITTKNLTPPLPLVRTDPVTDVSDTSARLHGWVQSVFTYPDDLTYRFRYNAGTGWQSIGSTTMSFDAFTALADSHLVTSLPANTEVSYTFCAANAAGEVCGDTLVFQTDAPPPCDDPYNELFSASVDGQTITIPVFIKNPNGDVSTTTLAFGAEKPPAQTQTVYVGTAADTMVYVKKDGLDPCTTYFWSVTTSNSCGAYKSPVPFNGRTEEPREVEFSNFTWWGPYIDGIDFEVTIEPPHKQASVWVQWGRQNAPSAILGEEKVADIDQTQYLLSYSLYFGDPGDRLFMRVKVVDECGSEYFYHHTFTNAFPSGIDREDQVDEVIVSGTQSGMQFIIPQEHYGKTLAIYDVLGRKVTTQQIHASTQHISVSSGYYIYHIGEHTGKVVVP